MNDTGWLCKVLADSVNEDGNRLTTMLTRFPRYVLAQITRHRAFSFSMGSSRAIPTAKLIKRIENDPVLPMWTKNQRGMSGVILDESEARKNSMIVYDIIDNTIAHLDRFEGIHKQNINRYLEPFAWVDAVISATEWENFFALRIHHDAQPELQILSKAIYLAMNKSVPVPLAHGKWHLPFIHPDEIATAPEIPIRDLIRRSAARCARVSYTTHDTGVIDIEADYRIADQLASSGHYSPYEHQASPTDPLGYRSSNFIGWEQARHDIDTMGWTRGSNWTFPKPDAETVTQWEADIAPYFNKQSTDEGKE